MGYSCIGFFYFCVMNMKYLFAMLIAILSCTLSRTYLTEYKRLPDVNHVVDSIESSGTSLSPEKTMVFNLDNGAKDTVVFRSLYKNGKATGSIQIRKENGLYNVLLIDVR